LWSPKRVLSEHPRRPPGSHLPQTIDRIESSEEGNLPPAGNYEGAISVPRSYALETCRSTVRGAAGCALQGRASPLSRLDRPLTTDKLGMPVGRPTMPARGRGARTAWCASPLTFSCVLASPWFLALIHRHRSRQSVCPGSSVDTTAWPATDLARRRTKGLCECYLYAACAGSFLAYAK
jgi:hypothetical protein